MTTVQDFHTQASAHFGKRARHRYPPKLRRLAATVSSALVASGQPLPLVAQRLGVAAETLRRWQEEFDRADAMLPVTTAPAKATSGRDGGWTVMGPAGLRCVCDSAEDAAALFRAMA